MKMKMMDAALKYAEANIPVMPLHWICEDGSCSCKLGRNCDSKGKDPLYTGWYKNSTADVEQIKKWWTKTPNANIGIPTGEKSGWLVLDVDDGGSEALSAFEATHGILPDTVTAVTGSGGRRYIFKYQYPDKPCRNHEGKRNDKREHLCGIARRKQRKVSEYYYRRKQRTCKVSL